MPIDLERTFKVSSWPLWIVDVGPGLLPLGILEWGHRQGPQGRSVEGVEGIAPAAGQLLERPPVEILDQLGDGNNIVGMCRAAKIVVTTTTEVCAENVCGLAKLVRDEIAHLRMPDARHVKNLLTRRWTA